VAMAEPLLPCRIYGAELLCMSAQGLVLPPDLGEKDLDLKATKL
jgi:hypothetical protein